MLKKAISQDFGHDIKNSIASIKAYVELSKRKLPTKKSPLHEYLKNIEIQTDKITNWVNKVLESINQKK